MNRRFFSLAVLALAGGCSGAGVSATDLRGKVSGEIAQIVANPGQLARLTGQAQTDTARVDAVRSRIAGGHAAAFDVPQLHDLRRFYSSPDGQVVTALAYAAEGKQARPAVDPAQLSRVEAAFDNPVIAQSVAILRAVLRAVFTAESGQ